MKVIPQINLDDYQYELPAEKIANYPLKERSASKLLISKNGKIIHEKFNRVSEYLNPDTLLVFNDTKVIPARIFLYKETGARIEVFLLEPIEPASQEQAMNAGGECIWHCMVGNSKRWNVGTELNWTLGDLQVSVTRLTGSKVRFVWSGDHTFSSILQELGKIPLPPYIKREAEEDDLQRYQTIYSKLEGAVAAPTAGLHFTDEVMHRLTEKGIQTDFVTLHVSAGTFQPIKEQNAVDHAMHREKVLIQRSVVERLKDAPRIAAVGTTSLRTLESLYWYGAMLEVDEQAPFRIKKLYPYEHDSQLSRAAALQNIIDKMDREGIETLVGNTEIFIFPGYQFRMISGLITNFHLPGSTLILLIAAFLGEDRWRQIYQAALDNEYRFLSYGDSSLLLPG